MESGNSLNVIAGSPSNRSGLETCGVPLQWNEDGESPSNRSGLETPPGSQRGGDIFTVPLQP